MARFAKIGLRSGVYKQSADHTKTSKTKPYHLTLTWPFVSQWLLPVRTNRICRSLLLRCGKLRVAKIKNKRLEYGSVIGYVFHTHTVRALFQHPKIAGNMKWC